MERKCETCKQVLPIERFTRDKSRHIDDTSKYDYARLTIREKL